MTHLNFDEYEVGEHRTKKFEVSSNGSQLGDIKWHSSWRQYVFEPCFDTIWSWECLKELSEFIKSLMDGEKND